MPYLEPKELRLVGKDLSDLNQGYKSGKVMEWGDINYDENKEKWQDHAPVSQQTQPAPSVRAVAESAAMQTAQQLMVCSSRSRYTLTHILTSCLCKLGHISSSIVGIMTSYPPPPRGLSEDWVMSQL